MKFLLNGLTAAICCAIVYNKSIEGEISMIAQLMNLSLIILSLAVLLLVEVVGIILTRKFRQACEAMA